MNKLLSDDDILSNVMLKAKAPARPRPKTRRRTRQLIEWKVRGFGPKARVMTSFGQLPVEALRRNDPVKTSTGDFLKVAWVDSFGLDSDFLTLQPQAQPMLIPAATFGPNRPEKDVLISPAQTLHISPTLGTGAVKAASELTGWGRIARNTQNAFTYHVFGFEKDCTVCIEGLWCDIPAQKS